MGEDIEKCCRLCLDVESSHVSIFGDPTISVHMRSCLGVHVFPSDPLPTDICMSCVSQLSQFYHFQINARCSQDWLGTAVQERSKKSEKTTIQPLPDSEYNSDSLLEFLNNTANIEEYLNNLGKEDIPAIVNMLEKNDQAQETSKLNQSKTKQPSPKKKDPRMNSVAMEIDVLDSDVEIVKEILIKKEPKIKPLIKCDKNTFQCYGCKLKFDNLQKFSQHVSVCETASRTCAQCDKLFDSRLQSLEHSVIHNALECNCGERFSTKNRLISHRRVCFADYTVTQGLIHRCKECKDTFKDRFQLYRHARQHILKSEEAKCDICRSVFIGHEALARHKRRDHESPPNNVFRCKVCSKTSKSRQEMYLHIQTHTNADPDRHLCDTCGRSFATRGILSRHATIHGVKGCSICGKQFENRKDRNEHYKQHGEVAMCEKCGQTINSREFDGHVCV